VGESPLNANLLKKVNAKIILASVDYDYFAFSKEVVNVTKHVIRH